MPLNNWNSLALILIAIGVVILDQPSPPTNDFAFYWTAAKLTLDGKNPYSPVDAVELQNRISFPGHGPLVMFNPPWILPLIVGFGLLSFSTAQAVWFFLSLMLLFVSVRWLGSVYGGPPWITRLLAATFLPVAVALAIGQIAPLLLFGLAGFVRFEARHQFLAGAFLFLAALKPQLVFLLWIALLLGAVTSRRWKALVGLLVTLAAASLLTLVFDSRASQQYLELFSQGQLLLYETPTLGGLLRHISGFPVLQYLPAAVALVWFGVEWKRSRVDWEWKRRLPDLVLVSVASTSYAWFFDQVVLLPSVFDAATTVLRSRRCALLMGLGYLAVNACVLLLLMTHRTFLWYSWTALAWLILRLVARCGVSDDVAALSKPNG